MEIPGNDSLRKAPFAASGHYQMKSVAESTTARYRVVPAVDNDGYNNEDVPFLLLLVTLDCYSFRYQLS